MSKTVKQLNYVVKIGEEFSGAFPKLGKAREYIRSIMNYNAVNGIEQEITLIKETVITEIKEKYNIEKGLTGKVKDVFN